VDNLNFKLLLLLTRVLLRAALCGFGVHFLARAKKRTKKARLGASP
jgi:hypothetical protein